MVEVLVSIALFVLLFTAIVGVIFPSSSDGHNQLRNYSQAMVLADWYVNFLESEIDREGEPKSVSIGKSKDVTNLSSPIKQQFELLRDFRVSATCMSPKQSDGSLSELLEITIVISWSKTTGDGRPYKLEILRYKVKPYAP